MQGGKTNSGGWLPPAPLNSREKTECKGEGGML